MRRNLFVKNYRCLRTALLLCILTSRLLPAEDWPGPAGAEPGSTPSSAPTESTYRLSFGESLLQAATACGIEKAELVFHNHITDERLLIPGQRLDLPGSKQKKAEGLPVATTPFPRQLTIDPATNGGRAPLSVDFHCEEQLADSAQLVWDFGDGCYAFTQTASHTYRQPGSYTATLTLLGRQGLSMRSNGLQISTRTVYKPEQAPSPPFLTAEYVGQILDLSGLFVDANGQALHLDNSVKLTQEPPLLEYVAENRFQAVAPGYTQVTLTFRKKKYNCYLFVSPFPTKHCWEPPFYWYKTQFDTGMYGNCGPACVAMVVHWATGQAISVIESRAEIGLPIKSGAISLEHMQANLALHRIPHRLTDVRSFADLRAIIDREHICIILFDTTWIQPVTGDKTLVFTDRYYPDTTGHYVVIKGYSLDEEFVVVYDPIPGDWRTNSFRYTDGYSMIGRNRYFRSEQILRSLKRPEVLELGRRPE